MIRVSLHNIARYPQRGAIRRGNITKIPADHRIPQIPPTTNIHISTPLPNHFETTYNHAHLQFSIQFRLNYHRSLRHPLRPAHLLRKNACIKKHSQIRQFASNNRPVDPNVPPTPQDYMGRPFTANIPPRSTQSMNNWDSTSPLYLKNVPTTATVIPEPPSPENITKIAQIKQKRHQSALEITKKSLPYIIYIIRRVRQAGIFLWYNISHKQKLLIILALCFVWGYRRYTRLSLQDDQLLTSIYNIPFLHHKPKLCMRSLDRDVNKLFHHNSTQSTGFMNTSDTYNNFPSVLADIYSQTPNARYDPDIVINSTTVGMNSDVTVDYDSLDLLSIAPSSAALQHIIQKNKNITMHDSVYRLYHHYNLDTPEALYETITSTHLLPPQILAPFKQVVKYHPNDYRIQHLPHYKQLRAYIQDKKLLKDFLYKQYRDNEGNLLHPDDSLLVQVAKNTQQFALHNLMVSTHELHQLKTQLFPLLLLELQKPQYAGLYATYQSIFKSLILSIHDSYVDLVSYQQPPSVWDIIPIISSIKHTFYDENPFPRRNVENSSLDDTTQEDMFFHNAILSFKSSPQKSKNQDEVSVGDQLLHYWVSSISHSLGEVSLNLELKRHELQDKIREKTKLHEATKKAIISGDDESELETELLKNVKDDLTLQEGSDDEIDEKHQHNAEKLSLERKLLEKRREFNAIYHTDNNTPPKSAEMPQLVDKWEKVLSFDNNITLDHHDVLSGSEYEYDSYTTSYAVLKHRMDNVYNEVLSLIPQLYRRCNVLPTDGDTLIEFYANSADIVLDSIVLRATIQDTIKYVKNTTLLLHSMNNSEWSEYYMMQKNIPVDSAPTPSNATVQSLHASNQIQNIVEDSELSPPSSHFKPQPLLLQLNKPTLDQQFQKIYDTNTSIDITPTSTPPHPLYTPSELKYLQSLEDKKLTPRVLGQYIKEYRSKLLPLNTTAISRYITYKQFCHPGLFDFDNVLNKYKNTVENDYDLELMQLHRNPLYKHKFTQLITLYPVTSRYNTYNTTDQSTQLSDSIEDGSWEKQQLIQQQSSQNLTNLTPPDLQQLQMRSVSNGDTLTQVIHDNQLQFLFPLGPNDIKFFGVRDFNVLKRAGKLKSKLCVLYNTMYNQHHYYMYKHNDMNYFYNLQNFINKKHTLLSTSMGPVEDNIIITPFGDGFGPQSHDLAFLDEIILTNKDPVVTAENTPHTTDNSSFDTDFSPRRGNPQAPPTRTEFDFFNIENVDLTTLSIISSPPFQPHDNILPFFVSPLQPLKHDIAQYSNDINHNMLNNIPLHLQPLHTDNPISPPIDTLNTATHKIIDLKQKLRENIVKNTQNDTPITTNAISKKHSKHPSPASLSILDPRFSCASVKKEPYYYRYQQQEVLLNLSSLSSILNKETPFVSYGLFHPSNISKVPYFNRTMIHCNHHLSYLAQNQLEKYKKMVNGEDYHGKDDATGTRPPNQRFSPLFTDVFFDDDTNFTNLQTLPLSTQFSNIIDLPIFSGISEYRQFVVEDTTARKAFQNKKAFQTNLAQIEYEQRLWEVNEKIRLVSEKNAQEKDLAKVLLQRNQALEAELAAINNNQQILKKQYYDQKSGVFPPNLLEYSEFSDIWHEDTQNIADSVIIHSDTQKTTQTVTTAPLAHHRKPLNSVKHASREVLMRRMTPRRFALIKHLTDFFGSPFLTARRLALPPAPEYIPSKANHWGDVPMSSIFNRNGDQTLDQYLHETITKRQQYYTITPEQSTYTSYNGEYISNPEEEEENIKNEFKYFATYSTDPYLRSLQHSLDLQLREAVPQMVSTPDGHLIYLPRITHDELQLLYTSPLNLPPNTKLVCPHYEGPNPEGATFTSPQDDGSIDRIDTLQRLLQNKPLPSPIIHQHEKWVPEWIQVDSSEHFAQGDRKLVTYTTSSTPTVFLEWKDRLREQAGLPPIKRSMRSQKTASQSIHSSQQQ